MRITILCVLLIIASFPVFGQIKNYRAYQQGIHAAELDLVRGQEQAALAKYYAVLTSSQGNFVKDVNNALVLADALEDENRFFELLDLLLPKNLGNKYLNDLEAFKKWHADARWQDFLATNEKTELPNSDLKTELEQLARDDQYFRLKRGSYKIYGDTIKHIDSINIASLLEIIAADNFPGEEVIGVRDIYGGQPTDIIFHHYCQSTSIDTKKMNLTPMLINLVLAGKVLPNKCGTWLELQKGDFQVGAHNVLRFKVDGKVSDWYIQVRKPHKQVLIDQTRQLLGMESLEEYYEKVRFHLADPMSSYKFDVQLSIIEAKQELFDRLVKNMRKL